MSSNNSIRRSQGEFLDVHKLLKRSNGSSSGDSCASSNSNLLKQKLDEHHKNGSSLLKSGEATAQQQNPTKPVDLYEKNIRSHFKVIRFIIICGKKLELGDLSLATATVIYNRFFYTCDFAQFDPYLIASSAIYLASKVEEEHVKLRDIVNVCYRTLHPNDAPLEICEKYWQIRNSITQCELLLVRMLEFKLNFDHPHKYLLNYLESLRHWIPLNLRECTPVPETCWHILRDALHSNLTLKHRPQEIAIAIIYLVFMCYGIKVPFNDIAQKSWWKSLDEKITRNKIHLIIEEIISIYEMDEELNLNNINFI